MDYQPEIYRIPINIADNGNALNGTIKTKNMTEAVIVAGIGVVISGLFLQFLSLGIRIAVFVPFFFIALVAMIGVRGESLFEYILEVFFFKKKKRRMKYKMPRAVEKNSRKGVI